ncbi:esterase [Microbacterium mangrovi]|uniref:Esterase n=1 Tax=Microbacterium mangrovi TaxID=1348253 RepID=A0A0B2A954_9MICO|nr:alpha/beta fold hydrolase [Microbacterium mangrovi]KHK99635.1 esterase [Microbacterium mangrovi]
MSDPDVPDLDPGAVLWSAPPAERAGRPLLVLLHGYGADEHDLYGLVPSLPDGLVVASVRAPLTPPWPAPGAAWYPIDDLSTRDPARVTDAAEAFLAWLDTTGHDAPVGLLGFSQGGAVALQSLRLRPDGFAFAVLLAGYAAPGDLPRDAELAELRPPVFWGRGARDEVIPASLVAHTTEWLPAHAELSGRVYAGLTHSVSQAELDDVATFLAKRLDALTPAPDPAT